jgi:hypothetical protein
MFSAGTGFDSSSPQPTLTLGAQGYRAAAGSQEPASTTTTTTATSSSSSALAPGDHAVVDTIMRTLETCAETGFAPEQVEAVLRQVELGVRRGSANMGIHLISHLMPVWIHGGDPAEDLDVTGFVRWIRAEIARGGFFESLIREELLDNAHRATVRMVPEDGYIERLEAEEARELEALRATADVDEIVASNRRLEEHQAQVQDVSCLPRIEVEDLPVTVPALEYHRRSVGSDAGNDAKTEAAAAPAPVLQWVPQPTNGMLYARVALDATGLDPQLAAYMPLYSRVATRLGAGEMGPDELALHLRLHTGGVSLGASNATDPRDRTVSRKTVTLAAASLDGQGTIFVFGFFFLFFFLFNSKFSYKTRQHQTFATLTTKQTLKQTPKLPKPRARSRSRAARRHLAHAADEPAAAVPKAVCGDHAELRCGRDVGSRVERPPVRGGARARRALPRGLGARRYRRGARRGARDPRVRPRGPRARARRHVGPLRRGRGAARDRRQPHRAARVPRFVRVPL